MPEGRQCSLENCDDFGRNADERSQQSRRWKPRPVYQHTLIFASLTSEGWKESVEALSLAALSRLVKGVIGLTKPLTMILLSPDAVDGPVGIALVAGLACFIAFLTPPTGVVVAPWALEGFWSRRR